ncbi:hypothetical protein [Streptomyces sp. NPDC055056]
MLTPEASDWPKVHKKLNKENRAPTPWVYLAIKMIFGAGLLAFGILTPLFNADSPKWIWPIYVLLGIALCVQSVGALMAKAKSRN